MSEPLPGSEGSITDMLGIEPKGLKEAEEGIEEPTPLHTVEEPAVEAPPVAVEEPTSDELPPKDPEPTPEEEEASGDPYEARIAEWDERLAGASPAAPEATPEVARLEGRVEELKARIEESGKVAEEATPASESTYDRVMNSPEVRAAVAEAQDDPEQMAKVVAIASAEAARLERESTEAPLRKELDEFKTKEESSRQQRELAVRFQTGLVQAASQSEGAKRLVRKYVDSGYSDQTVVGALFKVKPEFLNSETTMALGIEKVAREMFGDLTESGPPTRTAVTRPGKATLKGKQATEPVVEESEGDEYDEYSKRDKGIVNIPALASR